MRRPGQGGQGEEGGAAHGVDAEAVAAGDSEGVVFVSSDQQVWQGINAQAVIVGPEHGADVERQRAQVALGQDGLHKLQQNKPTNTWF